jgi:hypothetical protein
MGDIPSSTLSGIAVGSVTGWFRPNITWHLSQDWQIRYCAVVSAYATSVV